MYSQVGGHPKARWPGKLYKNFLVLAWTLHTFCDVPFVNCWQKLFCQCVHTPLTWIRHFRRMERTHSYAIMASFWSCSYWLLLFIGHCFHSIHKVNVDIMSLTLLSNLVIFTVNMGAGGFFLGLLIGGLTVIGMVIFGRISVEVMLSIFSIRDRYKLSLLLMTPKCGWNGVCCRKRSDRYFHQQHFVPNINHPYNHVPKYVKAIKELLECQRN